MGIEAHFYTKKKKNLLFRQCATTTRLRQTMRIGNLNSLVILTRTQEMGVSSTTCTNQKSVLKTHIKDTEVPSREQGTEVNSTHQIIRMKTLNAFQHTIKLFFHFSTSNAAPDSLSDSPIPQKLSCPITR